jgi:hypothetical protein
MAEKTVITMICCVCKKFLGTKDGQGITGTSHGYCPECAKAVWQKYLESKGTQSEVQA